MFVETPSLASIYVHSGNPVYDSRNNCNAIIETAFNTLLAGCQNTVIPEDVTRIYNDSFHGCKNLKSICIPENVKAIGERAFYGCELLSVMFIPMGILSLKERVFGQCDNLKLIVIPDSVTEIGDYAFIGCNSLESITIPSQVEKIGKGIFEYCNSLVSISVSHNNSVYDSRDNSNAIIETATNKLVATCKSTIIPDGVSE